MKGFALQSCQILWEYAFLVAELTRNLESMEDLLPKTSVGKFILDKSDA